MLGNSIIRGFVPQGTFCTSPPGALIASRPALAPRRFLRDTPRQIDRNQRRQPPGLQADSHKSLASDASTVRRDDLDGTVFAVRSVRMSVLPPAAPQNSSALHRGTGPNPSTTRLAFPHREGFPVAPVPRSWSLRPGPAATAGALPTWPLSGRAPAGTQPIRLCSGRAPGRNTA